MKAGPHAASLKRKKNLQEEREMRLLLGGSSRKCCHALFRMSLLLKCGAEAEIAQVLLRDQRQKPRRNSMARHGWYC